MALALDPRIQRVWRTPDCLQFGVEQPVLVLDGVSAADERMLAALACGVTRQGLQLLADRAGAPPGAAAALLKRIAPVLARGDGAVDGRADGSGSRDERPPGRPPLVVLDATGPTASQLARMLTDAGAEVRGGLAWDDRALDRAEAAVLVGSYAIEPQRSARWLRRDIPHLPIVFGDAGVTVGPWVRPGVAPCLRCVDLHRTAADPAWPVMATQLHTLPPPGEDAIVSAIVGARAAALVLAGVAAARGRSVQPPPVGASWRLLRARSEGGGADWVSAAWEPHPECGCLGLPP
ncbi:hypothetical protein [Leifsonia sp. 1010]|uniref:hypothetical protein n=1 Tax=Leifsonia sp. 1010 TaxID=2817769 RepID=UPI00285CE5AF|nr:hypothetical protein [Leifsonia sp. 1010]MDR6612779.1 hypothetical protein [Leifsonia sp. 1010]